MTLPIPKTKEQLEKILAEELEKIIRSNISAEAVERFGVGLEFREVSANLHLWERLGAAFAALGALRGYRGGPAGFIKVE
jgi:hypothetical protein